MGTIDWPKGMSARVARLFYCLNVGVCARVNGASIRGRRERVREVNALHSDYWVVRIGLVFQLRTREISGGIPSRTVRAMRGWA